MLRCVWTWGLLLSFSHFIFGQNGVESYSFTIPRDQIIALKNANNDVNQSTRSFALALTLPDRKVVEYKFTQNTTMDAALAQQYPEIKTFSGYSDIYKHHRLALTLFEDKIHLFILNAAPQAIMIDHIEGDQYKSYYAESSDGFDCSTDHRSWRPFSPASARTSTNGSTLRTYRFAVVITDEYEAANGNGAAAITQAVTTVNDLNVIYRRDLAVTMTVDVKPETSVFNINPASSGSTYGGTCVAAYFSVNTYDVGMLWHNPGGSGGSGVAQLAVVCNSNSTPPNKARSWSQANPNNGYMFLSIVVHEMAHMFNASHLFNASFSNCASQRSDANAYEVGSGTTLMSYPGVCDVDNVTTSTGSTIFSTSPYFHGRSLEQMVSFLLGSSNTCAANTISGNTPPTANANPCNAPVNINIPASTPFELNAQYTDPNASDQVTYCWEQFDLGPPFGAPNVACSSTTGPIFRSYSPSTSPIRTFPNMTYIINNANVPPFTGIGECLPSVARNLKFKVTVRDNAVSAGGIDLSEINLSVVSNVGPLQVTAPNTNVSWAAGSNQTITWSGFNTSSLCNLINIKLSIDGGLNFPYTLATNTSNDGSESITLPSNLPNTTSARIRIESNCFDCVRFFDLSNVHFTITSSCLVLPTTICFSAPIQLPEGNSGLNLNLTPAYGAAITSKTLTTAGSAVNTAYNLTPSASGPSTSCTSANLNFRNAVFKFKISQAGTYTFSMSGAHPLAVYNGTFNPASPCSNFMGSTAFDADGVAGGSLSISSSMQLTLNNACGDYTAVFSRALGTSTTLTITGPVNAVVYENNDVLPSGYAYTFVAVKNSDNIIASVSPTSNFTSLVAGNYCVYGVHYLNTLVPSTWVGSSIASLLGNGSCLYQSSNCTPMVITCPNTITSNANEGAGTLRSVFTCSTESASITFANGVQPILTSPLIFDKNIVINGSISGPVTTVLINHSTPNAFSIQSGKQVTLKDLNIQIQGSSSPAILNQGTLTLNNTQIISNQQHIQNASSGQTQIVNTVQLKKP